MELKNIFKMTKTDRYTQDGRDELAKLQETEDVTYKTGDISQKTGLQKQPDGSWAPPKGGAAPKMGSPEYNEKYGLTKRDVATGKEIDRIYEKHQKRIKELKAKGYTDEQIENDKIYQQTKEDMKNVGKSKPEEKSLAGTPMKKADLNSKDPYEITHSIKPDTASEAKEMDKISAFMQEETGATLRNAILARESFYKNTKNPTPEQQEGLAALMKIQQKLGYGKAAENKPAEEQSKPAATGSKKGQVLNTFKTGNADSKWDVNITGGENELANEFFEQHGARFNYHGKDVNLDDYVKPIDNNSFELKVFNAGNQSKGYYGKLVGKGNNTDIRYIVTKTPNGWNIQEKERRYYGLPERQQEYKLDNNKYIKDTPKDSAPRILTGDTKIRIKK